MKIKLKDIYTIILFIIVAIGLYPITIYLIFNYIAAIGLYPITIYLIFNYIINGDFNDNKR